jgi:NAD(P)-dependent dehydrogenase (short-subunit alcohol dehydrogenase family)
MSVSELTYEPRGRYPGLEGRVAVVTGTSHGIGCGIAEVLGLQGMKLVLTARSEERGLAFRDLLRGRGVECAWVTADLADRDDARRVLDAARGEFGRLDVLVNNAAIMGRQGPFQDVTPESFHRSFELNARIFFHVSQLAAQDLIQAGRGGSIVHISSVGGLRAHRNMSAYDAAKGAMDAMTRSMAVDLAPHGIRVNGVAPGAIGRYDPVGDRDERTDTRPAGGIPLGYIGRAHEVGETVAFMASDAASYITGQTLYVDGGLTTQLTPPDTFI